MPTSTPAFQLQRVFFISLCHASWHGPKMRKIVRQHQLICHPDYDFFLEKLKKGAYLSFDETRRGV